MLCVAGIRLAMRSEMFSATARIKVERPASDVLYPNHSQTYDPYFIQIEFEAIQSEAILGQVIDDLDLENAWSRRFAKGEALKWSETLALLRTRLELRPVRSTTLVEIRVVSEDPSEASKIANAIAERYADWRRDKGHRLIEEGLKSLETSAQEQEVKIKVANENLEKLRKELGLSETQQAELDKLHPEYARTKQQLEDMKDFLKLLERKIKLEKDELLIPKYDQVEIVDRAITPTRPVYPSRAINAAVALASFLAGVVTIGFGVLLLRRR
jgi:uncharacterized protein involved in exopolysaccharide biosynthesis